MSLIEAIKLELPANIDYLKTVHGLVENVGHSMCFAERDLMNLQLCTSELVTNAILYGSGAGRGKKIWLILELYDNKLVFKVRDQGSGFDLDSVRKEEQNPGEDRTHGRGIFLVDKFMDEVCCGHVDGRFEISATKYKLKYFKNEGEDLMEIQVKNLDDVCVATADGKLDAASTPILKDCIKKIVGEGKHKIVINMEKVPFINSTGLGTLVGILKELRVLKGVIKLCNLQPYVQELFEVTQLIKVFEIYDDEEAAVKSFEG